MSGVVPTATPNLSPQQETPEVPLRPAILEQRLLVIESPTAIRVGDSDLILLSLEVDREGRITPTASIAGHEVQGQRVQIPDVYETHAVMAEARLDISGLEISPAAEISEAVVPGQAVTFAWSVRPKEVGVYRGMVWLHLMFIPKAGGEPARTTLNAQRIEIKSVNLLGIGGSGARWLGALGALFGSIFGLDGVIGWIWKLVKDKVIRGKLNLTRKVS